MKRSSAICAEKTYALTTLKYKLRNLQIGSLIALDSALVISSTCFLSEKSCICGISLFGKLWYTSRVTRRTTVPSHVRPVLPFRCSACIQTVSSWMENNWIACACVCLYMGSTSSKKQYIKSKLEITLMNYLRMGDPDKSRSMMFDVSVPIYFKGPARVNHIGNSRDCYR